MKKLIILLTLSALIVSCGSEKEESKDDSSKSNSKKNTETSDTISVDSSETTSKEALGYAVEIAIGTDKYDETIKYYQTLGWELHGDEINQGGKMQRMFDGSMMLLIAEDTMKYMGPCFHTDTQESYERCSDLISVMEFKNGDKIAMGVYASPDSMDFAVSSEQVDFPEFKNTGALWADMDLSKLEFPNKACGTLQEFSISVENLDESIAYWENLGFEHKGVQDAGPYKYTIMYDGKFIIGLHETKGMWHGNHITYSGYGENNAKTAEAIKALGYPVEELEYGGQVMENNYIFGDPNGNTFYLFTDFAQ